MSRVLVTGAGGYVGSVLVPELMTSGHEVVAVDRFFFGREKLGEHQRLTVVRDDTRRLSSEQFRSVNAVIDLAAVSNDPAADRFRHATWDINSEGRIRTAKLARESGVQRYILASSASVYGWKESPAAESDPPNPQSAYAEANVAAENGVLDLASDKFCVTALRQATLYGLSPRMRFDLAINGMTYGAWKTGKLPLMKDGTQFRPMLHVRDTADLMVRLVEEDSDRLNGECFNVGNNNDNFRIGELGETIASLVSEYLKKKIDIEWYGDPDTRNYLLNCDKINRVLGWHTRCTVREGVKEILDALQAGQIDKTTLTLTLDWYRELVRWHRIIRDVEMYGGILDIEEGDSK